MSLFVTNEYLFKETERERPRQGFIRRDGRRGAERWREKRSDRDGGRETQRQSQRQRDDGKDREREAKRWTETDTEGEMERRDRGTEMKRLFIFIEGERHGDKAKDREAMAETGR